MKKCIQLQYDIYMIHMSEHPISQMYVRLTEPSWRKFGHKLNFFEAVTPKDLYKKNKLIFNRKDRDFTETEKAVWYSHFELWCKCLNSGKGMIIIEHDSKLVKSLPNLQNEGYKYLSYMKRDFGKYEGKCVLSPGSGYYITPIVAQRLIASAVAKDIEINSDGHICDNTNIKRQTRMNDFYYIEQINIDGLNTIDHKNPHRNYVGLDYEKIDIPSIHGQEI